MVPLLVLIVLLLLVIVISKNMKHEGFGNTDTTMECPISALRTPDGRIRVEPGGHIFSTMDDYVAYLSGLYSSGNKCIPPMVKEKRDPIDGILGGLGVGAPSPRDVEREGATREVLNTDLSNEQTFAKTPINKLDDYEYTRVYDSERDSRNVMPKEEVNKLMENRILDWSNLPFNSEAHAAGADDFVAGRMEDVYVEPKSGVFFKNMRGDDTLPPDAEAAKLREQQILASYRPTDITKHHTDSKTEEVAKLVNELYENDPNWIPVVEKTNDNNFAITELIPKPRKERWEDVDAQRLSLKEEKGEVIPPPTITIDDRLRGDPYFDKSGVGDRDNDRFWNYNDFRKWTPGLERMFAPTFDNKEWY